MQAGAFDPSQMAYIRLSIFALNKPLEICNNQFSIVIRISEEDIRRESMSSGNASSRQRRRTTSRKRGKSGSMLLYILGGVGLLIVGAVIYGVITNRQSLKPMGEAVPISESYHVESIEDAEYTSDPPTSGIHLEQSASAGFYGDEEVSDGLLIHSLEHGYTIIWYDCSPLSDGECQDLASDIESYVSGRAKTIGIAKDGMESTVILTSWGRMMQFDTFDRQIATDFHRANTRLAPEPNAH